MYGSHATGLALASSDVDFFISLPRVRLEGGAGDQTKFDADFYQTLLEMLEQCKWVTDVVDVRSSFRVLKVSTVHGVEVREARSETTSRHAHEQLLCVSPRSSLSLSLSLSLVAAAYSSLTRR